MRGEIYVDGPSGEMASVSESSGNATERRKSVSLIVPTGESEWLETAFHKVIQRRNATPRDSMIACLALFVKAALSCDPPLTEEQMLMLVRARYRSPHALDIDKAAL